MAHLYQPHTHTIGPGEGEQLITIHDMGGLTEPEIRQLVATARAGAAGMAATPKTLVDMPAPVRITHDISNVQGHVGGDGDIVLLYVADGDSSNGLYAKMVIAPATDATWHKVV